MSEEHAEYVTAGTPIELAELIGPAERDLLVTAAQALHRERANAWRAARDHADLTGGAPPGQDVFGLAEVNIMLRRLGAAARCA